MLFWIFVILFIISSIGVFICYDNGCDTGLVLIAVSTVTLTIAVLSSICIIIDAYSHAEANVAKYQKRYESLVYQYENAFYDNDNDVGKYELVFQIERWNTDLAYHKTIQRDFWLGIYYPNIYDQFAFIELNKEVIK